MIGLVGGLGVGATVHYYREIAAAHDRLGRPLSLSMVHAQVSRVFECAAAGDRAGLARYLADILSQLKASGATLGVIPALTPHLAIDELMAISPLPLVSAIEAVNQELAVRRLRRVALFGTRFVVETKMFGRLKDVEVVPLSPDDITFVHDTYSQLAREGSLAASKRDRLVSLATSLCEREGVEAILFAGTDLTLLFDATNTTFPYLDCADAHLRAIMRAVAEE